MALHLLTDRKIRAAKPKAKSYRLADGGNLYLCVATSGVKSWQFRYRLNDKPQTASLGKWDTVTLADARAAAGMARREASRGEQLTAAKHAAKLARTVDSENTFSKVAAAWVSREARRMRWSPDYQAEVEASLRNHLSPLNRLPLTKIVAPVTAPILRAIEHKAPHMLEKLRRRLHAIIDYAVEQGAIAGNPLPTVRRGAKVERRHYPAVTALPGIGEILRNGRLSDPCKGIQRAHLLLAFLAMRVSEVVGAQWTEFELDAAIWRIPRQRMKRKDQERGPHEVPIPAELLLSLREWRQADGLDAIYVCPAPRDASKPITAESVEKHYRRALDLAGKHSPHSWRSAFSTVCREAGKDAASIDSQLDHVVGNKTSAAYDRAKRLQLRRELMNWYEQQLIAARDGAPVLSLRRA